MIYPIKPGKFIYADRNNYILGALRAGTFINLEEVIQDIIEHFIIMNTSLADLKAIYKIRGIFYDDIHGCCRFFVDRLYDDDSLKENKHAQELFEQIETIDEKTSDTENWQIHCTLEFRHQNANFDSDKFKTNHHLDYDYVMQELGW